MQWLSEVKGSFLVALVSSNVVSLDHIHCILGDLGLLVMNLQISRSTMDVDIGDMG